MYFRSRPVVNVRARLTFHPEEISTDKIDCFGSTDENLPMVTLRACFEMREATKSNSGGNTTQYGDSFQSALRWSECDFNSAACLSVELISGLNISCKFDVDAMRQTSRGFFSETDKKARTQAVTYELRDTKEDTCFNYSIYMPVRRFDQRCSS